MHDIYESIETIRNIIYDLPDDTNRLDEFKVQYEKISLKSRDPNFYLSTIGDFSCGKSTLINALIRRKLLKVAHTATTAVPTYIYKGINGCLAVVVRSEEGKRYNLTSEADVSAFEKDFGLKLPEALDERISLLTADRELTLKISDVNIELPDDTISSNLCIIDTPGINPGANFTEKHVEITKNILNENADAIIVLFPADQAYTQSFEKFLKDNAEYFMKDAIFVVTMMDRVDEEEREDVINFVKANLRTSFDLKNPEVLSCSAMKFGKDPYWTEEFLEFERQLTDRLKNNRQRIINEKLVKLSNELLNSIEGEVVNRKKSIEERLSVLQTHTVPNLVSVLANVESESINKLLRIKDEHNRKIKENMPNLETTIMRKVNFGLDLCDSRSAVTKYVNESLSVDLEFACGDICKISRKYIKQMNKEMFDATSEMIEKMKIYYGEIGGALPRIEKMSASAQRAEIEGILTDLSKMIGDYEFKVDMAALLGGAGLTALILTGLGPIGWIVGGVAAFMFGGDKLMVNSAKDKVRSSVSEKIPSISEPLEKNLIDGMLKSYIEVLRQIRNKKLELIAQYKPIYEKLENQIDAEKKELNRQIRQSENIQNRIRTVLLEINQ